MGSEAVPVNNYTFQSFNFRGRDEFRPFCRELLGRSATTAALADYARGRLDGFRRTRRLAAAALRLAPEFVPPDVPCFRGSFFSLNSPCFWPSVLEGSPSRPTRSFCEGFVGLVRLSPWPLVRPCSSPSRGRTVLSVGLGVFSLSSGMGVSLISSMQQHSTNVVRFEECNILTPVNA